MNLNRDIKKAKEAEELCAWQLEFMGGGRTVMLMKSEYSDNDFLLGREKNGVRYLTGVGEFRERPDTKKHAFETTLLRAAKVEKMRMLGRQFEVPPIFIMKWMDTGYEWVDLTRPFRVEVDFARKDPKPSDKKESICHIPVEWFKPF